jgi:hypothetical protein
VIPREHDTVTVHSLHSTPIDHQALSPLQQNRPRATQSLVGGVGVHKVATASQSQANNVWIENTVYTGCTKRTMYGSRTHCIHWLY